MMGLLVPSRRMVYTARLSEVDLLRYVPEEPVEPPFAGIHHHVQHGCQRTSIEQLLAYLGTLQDAGDYRITDTALEQALSRGLDLQALSRQRKKKRPQPEPLRRALEARRHAKAQE